MTQEEQRQDPEEERDTRESDAVGAAPVSFEQEQVEAVGDPAAASVEAEPTVVEPVIPEPGAADPVAVEPVIPEPSDAYGQSPLEAQRRGSEEAESPPIAAFAGAFVGAFVAAKLLGRLGGGGD